MQPIDFPGANLILKAPPEWDTESQGPCIDLHVLRVNDDNEHYMLSKWKPTWRERLLLLLGRPVELRIATTTTHPPVMLYVD